MPKRLTDKQRDEIAEKYQAGSHNCSQLAREYDVSRKYINGILRKRNIKIKDKKETQYKKYRLNQDYFEKIDTEEKAYFLGLLYADGCNSQNVNHIRITLQEEDRHILESFNKAIESNRPVKFNNGLRDTSKDFYSLCISNKKMSNDLAKLGCVQAKSLILKFPTEEQVPKHLQKHFIRGMFDGDGSISSSLSKPPYDKNIKAMITITSTGDFCEILKQIVKKDLGLHSCIVATKISIENNKSTRIWTGSGTYASMAILEWLYKDATIYLYRKYDKFLKIHEAVKSRKLEIGRYAFGENKKLKDWSRDKRCAVHYTTLLHRLKVGWDIERAISEPPGKKGARK